MNAQTGDPVECVCRCRDGRPVPVVPVRREEVTRWRRALGRLPLFCRDCGRAYVRLCEAAPEGGSTFRGLGCPNGHRGFLMDRKPGGGGNATVYQFDNVTPFAARPSAV